MVVHFEQAPPAAQYGLAEVGHASAPLVPLSPLQATQLFVATLHAGVLPVHAVSVVAVQATHWFVVVLHAGVPPLHVELVMQGSHLLLFAPELVTQTPELHCADVLQVPSPRLIPHMFALVSHAPLAHTIVATCVVHVPETAGVCPTTVGIGLPLGSVFTHAFVGVLQ